jgi:hypothetical protein
VLFDTQNLFYHTGSTYAFTSGEFVNLATVTATTGSSVINMGVAQDMGMGDGMGIPKIAVLIGTAFTSSSSGLRLNFAIQGSTDSTNWTTYSETGALATSSLTAGKWVLPIDLPRRPSGASLPQYYRMNATFSGTTVESISSGTIIGGLVQQRSDSDDTLGLYSSGFTVTS